MRDSIEFSKTKKTDELFKGTLNPKDKQVKSTGLGLKSSLN